jgi:hypothetical protein
VNIGEAEDAPTGQGGLVVFLHVGDEARSAVVATVDPDAAFDLTRSLPLVSPFGLPGGRLPRACPGAWFNECAGGDVGEVGAPLASWVKSEFPFERWPLNGEPEEFEAAFEAGTMVAVVETLTGDHHLLGQKSTGWATRSSLFFLWIELIDHETKSACVSSVPFSALRSFCLWASAIAV